MNRVEGDGRVGVRLPTAMRGDGARTPGAPKVVLVRAAEEDAKRARVEAKMRKMHLDRLSDEDGLAERKAALGELLAKAELYFESGLWNDAFHEFTRFADQCEEAEKFDRERKEAIAERERQRREAEERARRDAEERARREAEEKAEAERRRIGPPSGTLKTIVLPGGAEMRLRWCRPGTFLMGSHIGARVRRKDETQHQVTLTSGFWIGETPVTQKQWESVMDGNPSYFKGDDRPVESVSWNDCQEFISKVNASLACRACLPTEAEWEYACRAGTKGEYGGTGNLDDMGWYDNTFWGVRVGTHPVAQKKPNAWGLYDMHGNVWEWCQDWYGIYSGNATDPTGPASGDDRVLRGGGWDSDASFCRSASRYGNGPGHRSDSCGFRLCCSAGSRE